MLPTLYELQSALGSGATTSLELTEQALSKAEDPAGQGALVFTRLYRDRALASAQASDLLRRAGVVRSPLEGLPISIKDLFDVKGEPTQSGSIVLRGAPAAKHNAVIVERLVRAGAVITAKTNMVEFAYSGLGLNPHYGTPHSPWEPELKRIPGGSSSGAGVAVAEGMSVVSIGSDTGGSVRIPAAFCGVTGFKPTARRVSTRGALPLSTTLDSIGGLAASVSCCATVDAILSGESAFETEDSGIAILNRFETLRADRLRLVVPANNVLDGADAVVRSNFAAIIQLLRDVGAQIDTLEFPEFSHLADINAEGGFIAAEAWAWHKDLLASRASEYDPRVASRIERGREMTAASYIGLLRTRENWIASVDARLRNYDALLMPTVPIVAPRIDDLRASDAAYFEANRLILRNTTIINFLDGCALSIPCHQEGQAPMGLMVAGSALRDAHILNAGAAIEDALRSIRKV